MIRRRFLSSLLLFWAVLVLLMGIAWGLDRSYPLDLSRLADSSVEVVSRDGRLLRAFTNRSGNLRLPVRLQEVDPKYVDLLIAFEDRRFRSHLGVDPLALLRASWQALEAGRVISGGSTLTMQAVRLLEPRPRTLGSKVIEIFRALQLEARFSKSEILEIYINLAPFGGNLEGLRAASLRYLGRRPGSLTLGEAALLVVLPQMPGRLRPDRFPEAATVARNKVLERAAGIVSPRYDDSALIQARAQALRLEVRALPFLAPHLVQRLKSGGSGATRLVSTLDDDLQRELEKVAQREAIRLGPGVAISALVVDNETRKVRVYLGNSDFWDRSREGQVDAVQAIRSPGSTLKPAIYALAFERGLAHPATYVDDVPTRFGNYAPANFMERHYGRVSLAEALQLSLNVPAVALLEKLGPVAFTESLRQEGLHLEFGGAEDVPGLAVALGGVGTSLEDLVRIYAGLASDGCLRPLIYAETETGDGKQACRPFFGEVARAAIEGILSSAPKLARLDAEARPAGRKSIAFKTGTSYGFRDAWAIGYNAGYTVGVWVGRPDGTPNPGHYGANTAAPLLFRVFDALAPTARDYPWSGKRFQLASNAELAPGLRHLNYGSRLNGHQAPPRILFPPDGSRIEMDGATTLVLEAEGGRRPFTWIVNGQPLSGRRPGWQTAWLPDGLGYHEVMLTDSLGRQVRSRVELTRTEGVLRRSD